MARREETTIGKVDRTDLPGKLVLVSGGFDPLHIGHVRLFENASKLGNLLVLVNNDNWLIAKKGYNFMQEDDRVEIIKALRCVSDVVLTRHENDPTDMSVCTELRAYSPDIFANGGDRKANNIPEYQLCNELDIQMVFNIGGDKIRSSSELASGSISQASKGDLRPEPHLPFNDDLNSVWFTSFK